MGKYWLRRMEGMSCLSLYEEGVLVQRLLSIGLVGVDWCPVVNC